MELEKQKEQLETQNHLLKYELMELRTRLFAKGRKKRLDENGEKKSKKLGAPIGHPGWYRKRPDKIDEIVDIDIDKCPICGSSHLSKCQSKVEEHIQEDVILPQVKATLYRRHYKYCSSCKQVVSGIGDDELLGSYIGPTAKAIAVFMKYKIKMSDRDIKEIFDKLFNLKIDTSSMSGFRNQITRKGTGIYEHLKEEIKKAPYVNIDETGWKLDGESRWLWSASNDKICVNHIDKSRGGLVVKKLLGENYIGIIISDFLSAYGDKIKALAKQKCIPHLFRELKRVKACYIDDFSIQRYCKYLKDLLGRAIKLKDVHYSKKKYSHKEYARKCKRIEKSLEDFQFPDPRKGILLRLAKRLKKYKKELLTFLYHKDIPHHNNHAEQMIRPNVLLRKIIFGNRSPKGILNHNVLMSLLQTAKLNGRDGLKLMKLVLLSKNKDELIRYILPP